MPRLKISKKNQGQGLVYRCISPGGGASPALLNITQIFYDKDLIGKLVW
ncbi:hypothetical protein [Nostoc sp. LPT]|nr:hypothetical protein [Nostoc sp. LPT]MBN4004063.1 hypothetical protein [Nostoc sp. LPT]